MLQPRSFLSLRRPCQSCPQFSPYISKRPFFLYHPLFQEGKPPKPPTTYFIPAAVNTTPSFRDSPIKSPTSNSFSNLPTAITIDNIGQLTRAQLPQTGKYTGRTVSCTIGRADLALATLNRISKDNRIQDEWQESKVRYKPSKARQLLRSKRHRIRFNQGIARLVNIVLQMRKKSY